MEPSLQLLCVALDPLCLAAVVAQAPGLRVIEAACDLDRLVDEAIEPAPTAILCGPPPEGLSLAEVAQGLRLAYPRAPIFFLTCVRERFDRSDFVKNGFTDAYLLPGETAAFARAITDALTLASGGAIKAFREVRLIDLTPGVALPFDTYLFLPANRKHLKYSSAGDPLDAERVERLQRHHVGEMRVTSDQLPEFYKFTAEQLRRLGRDPSISETERQERMCNAVRGLLTQLFNDDSASADTSHGKSLVSDCQQIVKQFVLAEPTRDSAWLERLLNSANSGDGSYSRAAAVSTIAALFSIGTAVGKPEHLAMAGMLYDLGLVDLPANLQGREERTLSHKERVVYRTHVELGLRIIRDRKLVLPEEVLLAIETHHERLDGSGYPQGESLNPRKFPPEAQLLAIAIEFERLTAVQEGEARVSPLDAMTRIKEDCFRNPGVPKFDSKLMRTLLKLFQPLSATEGAPAEPTRLRA